MSLNLIFAHPHLATLTLLAFTYLAITSVVLVSTIISMLCLYHLNRKARHEHLLLKRELKSCVERNTKLAKRLDRVIEYVDMLTSTSNDAERYPEDAGLFGGFRGGDPARLVPVGFPHRYYY